MRVKIYEKSVDIESIEGFRQEEYLYMKTQFEFKRDHIVYGLLMKQEKLFILMRPGSSSYLVFVNSLYFYFTDNKCSSYWKIFLKLESEFDEFDEAFFIGPDRLLNEPDFYRRYLEYNDQEALKYMLEFRLNVDQEQNFNMANFI